jgi:lactoylglutathione lyase
MSSENEKEHIMKFMNVRLLVGDIAASIKFWRDVMGLQMTYGDEAMGYAYFETGSAGIELMTRAGFASALGEAFISTPQGYPAGAVPKWLSSASNEAFISTPQGYPAVLDFRVEDVDAAYTDFVKRGATAIAGPQDRPAWGVRSAHLSDPNGYIVELYSQLPSADAPTA